MSLNIEKLVEEELAKSGLGPIELDPFEAKLAWQALDVLVNHPRVDPRWKPAFVEVRDALIKKIHKNRGIKKR